MRTMGEMNDHWEQRLRNRFDLRSAVAVVGVCVALYAVGYAMGMNGIVVELKGQVATLQATVTDRLDDIEKRDIVIAKLTSSLDYQEETDATKVFIAKYIQSRNRSIGSIFADLLAETLVAAGNEFNFDPLFLAAQAGVESAFEVYDTSTAGAVGVMQVMPSIWVKKIPFLERRDDLYNIHANIRAGAFIMDHYRSTCGGTIRQALTCYHGGPRALKLPRSSTTAYVSRVLARWKTLEIM